MNAPTQTKTARVELGEVLRFHREQRGLKPRRVADMLGCSVEAVANYESGLIVPEGKHWDKYKAIVDRRLVAFNELRFRALNESRAEREQIISSMEHRQMATSNLTNGHSKPHEQPLTHRPLASIKIQEPPDARTVKPGAEVGYHNEPPPARKLHAKPEALAARGIAAKPSDTPTVKRGGRSGFPPGAMTAGNCAAREEWARLQFRHRPRMPIGGPDGLIAMMKQRFGVGIGSDTAKQIKDEINAELAGLPPAVPAGVLGAPDPKPVPTIEKPAPIAHVVRETRERDIGAAVQLVLDAIPNLSAFKIEVDDTGEASISYTVREVKIVETGGTMKVRR